MRVGNLVSRERLLVKKNKSRWNRYVKGTLLTSSGQRKSSRKFPWKKMSLCWAMAEVSMEEDVAVLGYGGRMQTFAGNSMVSGRFLNGREFAGDEKKCVISDKLAAMADLQIRDRIRIHREEFEIIGIMHGYGKNKVVVPYDCFADIYGHHSMQQSVMAEKDSDLGLVREQLSSLGTDGSQIFLQSLEESGGWLYPLFRY